ncbi:MAG: hypothetical protein UY63_C0017G0008 [Parcubacteria group bacterium GW2011_GWA2_51_10]|nr:MAG: hypothetical protein UY63_C0017G0008 [Parcubacteria group bacterium GW2011_GWA2_51_10]
MSPSPTGSFFKFLVGFLVFISVSFAVTYGVQKYEMAQSAEEQAAAAIRALVGAGD